MERITLHVQGMSCGHCISAVEGSVGKLKGVKSVQVTLDHGTVGVEFDPNIVSLKQIKSEIENQGYELTA